MTSLGQLARNLSTDVGQDAQVRFSLHSSLFDARGDRSGGVTLPLGRPTNRLLFRLAVGGIGNAHTPMTNRRFARRWSHPASIPGDVCVLPHTARPVPVCSTAPRRPKGPRPESSYWLSCLLGVRRIRRAAYGLARLPASQLTTGADGCLPRSAEPHEKDEHRADYCHSSAVTCVRIAPRYPSRF